MKIGIHHTPDSFSDRWIDYCQKKTIKYKIVNAYDSDIVNQLKGCDAFMWHYHQGNYRDVLFAKQLLYSLQLSGVNVFPDFNTAWHFDDKVGQKYLLESIDAPLVPSYVFYSKKEAEKWINCTTFPKVFKLRGGAGSANVKLVKTRKSAIRLSNKAFGRGFSQYDKIGSLKERIRKVKEGKAPYIEIVKGLVRLFIPNEFAKMHQREKGYIYFQEFIPNNKFDIRIIIIGGKAFGLKRMVRKNDFRASGSGNIIFDMTQIDERCVKISFDVNKKLKSQSIAFDYVFDEENNPLIVEISYGFAVSIYDLCEGYWDSNLNWHKGEFNPQEWMVEDIILKCK